MILRSVTFTDFGVYGGTQTLDLAPDSDGAYDRPIVLFRGKNGVGKTTFVEGVRLALHGALALGPRVARTSYEHHLRRRVHRPAGADSGSAPTEASVRVVLDFVRGGQRRTYDVMRSWRLAGASTPETVSVLEDGEPPAHVAADDYDSFLRELVPAVAGDLFFFDGEKIDRLVDDEAADEALGAAIEQLLGLHLVKLLDTDLGVYIDRAIDRADRSAPETELAEARALRDTLMAQATEDSALVSAAEEVLTAMLVDIQRREQQLATEGGAYAQSYGGLKEARRALQVEIETGRRRLIELASGVLPFALAPRVLKNTLEHMDAEAEHRDARAVKDLVDTQRRTVQKVLQSEDTYRNIRTHIPTEGERADLAQAVLDVMFDPGPEPCDAEDVYLHASDNERAVYGAWHVEAAGPVVDAVREAATELAGKQASLERTEEALALAPPDLILQPIIEALTRLRTRRTEQEEELDALMGRNATSHFKLEKAENRLERAQQALRSGADASASVRLATRARQAFEDYANTLRARKVSVFADVVLTRFNELSRKARLLDAVHVDPDTFAVTLRRDGRAFGRAELSAGEKQLFAVSALWALREVSEVPMPVVVDTPLGRLDSDHRLAMVRTFFPHVAHQVILLATDTEVDRSLAAEIAPAVSHGYRMSFDNETGSTLVERFSPDDLARGDAELADPEAGDGHAGDGMIELDVLS